MTDHISNKVCLITGATSGIGLQTAIELAEAGLSVVFTARDLAKAKIVKEEIIRKTGNNKVDYFGCDLASFESISDFHDQFKLKYPSLDILINNAGIWETEYKESVDGIELNLAVNYLAPFLLTNLCLEELERAGKSRIINVSSGLYKRGKIDFNDLEMKKTFSSWPAYSRTKLALVLFTKELAKRLDSSKITVNALAPGFVRTNLGHDFPLIQRLAMKLLAVSTKKGAATSVYLALNNDVEKTTGKFFENSQEQETTPEANDEIEAQKLWQIAESYLKNYMH